MFDTIFIYSLMFISLFFFYIYVCFYSEFNNDSGYPQSDGSLWDYEDHPIQHVSLSCPFNASLRPDAAAADASDGAAAADDVDRPASVLRHSVAQLRRAQLHHTATLVLQLAGWLETSQRVNTRLAGILGGEIDKHYNAPMQWGQLSRQIFSCSNFAFV